MSVVLISIYNKLKNLSEDNHFKLCNAGQLIDEIKNDIRLAEELLSDAKLSSYQRHELFDD